MFQTNSCGKMELWLPRKVRWHKKNVKEKNSGPEGLNGAEPVWKDRHSLDWDLFLQQNNIDDVQNPPVVDDFPKGSPHGLTRELSH